MVKLKCLRRLGTLCPSAQAARDSNSWLGGEEEAACAGEQGSHEPWASCHGVKVPGVVCRHQPAFPGAPSHSVGCEAGPDEREAKMLLLNFLQSSNTSGESHGSLTGVVLE